MPRCKNPAYKKGELWWLNDPMEWDEPTGLLHGRRPCVIISANKSNSVVIVAPVTTQTERKIYSSQFDITLGRVRCEQARAIDKKLLHPYITNLDNEEYHKLDKALIALFNININQEDNNEKTYA